MTRSLNLFHQFPRFAVTFNSMIKFFVLDVLSS